MTSRRHRLRSPESLGLVLGKSQLRPRDRAARRIERLKDPRAFAWRETREEFDGYVRLLPSDPEKTSPKLLPVVRAARYVRRVAHRAALGRGVPPTPRAWAILGARMARVFAWVGGAA
jgi:hypothetical protein